MPQRHTSSSAAAVAIPGYLEQVYWWAYLHPRAVKLFERPWLVNFILLGNYAKLREAALAELQAIPGGRTLQVACVYGNLTARLQQRLGEDGNLEVMDVLPIQLKNLRQKLPAHSRVVLTHADATAIPREDASYDQVLLFFLLHEQPESVRRATLAEALRVVKPGGRVVLVDYHQPSSWHPLKLAMRVILRCLEPYALDLWRHEVSHFLPPEHRAARISKRTYFGGLYQRLVIER